MQNRNILKEKKIEYKFLHSIRPMKGHKVWEINIETKDVKEASYKETDIIDFHEAQQGGTNIRDIIKKKGFIYLSALSPKSALKRLSNNKEHADLPKGWLKL